MQPAGMSALFKLILVLFLSVKELPQDAGRGAALETLAPAGASAYAVLDVAQLRALIQEDAELAKALFAGRSAEASFGEAIEALSQQTRVDPGAMREAVARVRTVGVWGLGMTDRREPRYVVVADRGGAPDILPKLFGGLPAKEDDASTLRTIAYAGRTLYAVGREPREAIWFAEINGLLALASDALAAETFLLQAGAAAGAPTGSRPDVSGTLRPLLQARADAGSVVNSFLPAMGDHDRAELMAAGAFVDLPAWRGVTVRLDRDAIVLRGEIAPGSPLAGALQPTQAPELLDLIPADAGLAVVASVRDAARIWDLVEMGCNHVAFMERGRNPKDELVRDFQRAMGLDIQKDVIPNLVAAAMVVVDPANGLRLDRGGALYFEGRDAARMLAAVQTFLAQEHKNAPVEPEIRDGVKVWRADDTLIALKGKVVMVAPRLRGEAQAATDRLLAHFIAGTGGLRKIAAATQPGTVAFATLDAARCLPQSGLERLTAGLQVSPAGATIRIESGSRKLVAGLVRLMADASRDASARAQQTRAMQQIRQIAIACIQYEAEYTKLPAELGDLKTYLGDLDKALRDTRSGQPFRLNPAVAGQPLKSIKNTSETVLVYAPPGAQPICAAFCDGSVRMLTPPQMQNLLNPPTRTE